MKVNFLTSNFNAYKTTFAPGQLKREQVQSNNNLSLIKHDVYIKPAVSFGMTKEQILEKNLSLLVRKYSSGENPVIKNVKEGFISRVCNDLIKSEKSIIVGVTGESASGKSAFFENVKVAFNKQKPVVEVIKGDNFYYDQSHLAAGKLSAADVFLEQGGSFDDPKSVNLKLFNNKLLELKDGKTINIPDYQYGVCVSTPDKHTIEPRKVVCVDSIFALRPELEDVVDIGIYVDCKPEILRERWFERAPSRNIFREEAEKQFKDVKEKAQTYIIPTKEQADVILNGEASLAKVEEFVNELHNIFKHPAPSLV